MNLPYKVIKEISLISGTLIIVFLWLSSQFSDNRELSLIFLAGYMILDQLQSRFWVKLMEKMIGGKSGGDSSE